MKMIPKACPVVLRPGERIMELLVFEHPLAGHQLVKGTIEPNEPPELACLRELNEETGLTGIIVKPLGQWQSLPDSQHWYFFQVKIAGSTPETWEHWTLDGGGLKFRCYWLPLLPTSSEQSLVTHPFTHPLFIGAFQFLLAQLKPLLEVESQIAQSK